GLTPHAAAPESSLRIAALEALVRHGPAARPAIEPLLADRSTPVRRALLEGIATGGAGDPLWIPPVLATYRTAVGLVRADCVRALEALTNQKFGDAQAQWEEWFSDYKGEIEGGKFKKDAIEVREATPQPTTPTCSFYGIPTPGLRVVLACEGSRRLFWPADLDVLVKQYKETWHRTRRSWEETNPSQLATLLQEFDRTTSTFAPDILLGAIVIYAACDTEALGGKKLVHPEKREIRAIRHDLERLPGDGWCAQYEGLLAAASMLGMGPESDADFALPQDGVIFLWDAGGPQGGRYMTPESAIAAFKRFNRFRRLVVNTVRICDEGEPGETLMKGLAAASGGAYVWAKKPRLLG
ncbi:MAG: HEAT repeat domain-containing protein, partial [Planctomycetes bacterium]|nr:HEAT repeat domain-containing protein [Planctomycetota bacterium]